APVSWANECSNTTPRSYQVCVGSDQAALCDNTKGGTSIDIDGTASSDPATSTTYTQSVPGTYYWKIRAINKAGYGSSWSPNWSFVIDNKVPSLTSINPVEIPSTGTSGLSLVTTDLDGASDIASVYLAFSNCSADPSEAGWSNFEHNNANFFGAASVVGGGALIAAGNANAACTGTVASPTTPWGAAPGSNATGKLTLNSVSNTPSGNNLSSVFNITTNGFVKGNYNYFGMVQDKESLYHTGTTVASWKKLGAVCVEGFTAPVDPVAGNTYVTGWSSWSTCDNGPGPNAHTRFRTRTCTEDCVGGTNDCANYLAANCPGGNCTVAGNTQTQRENCIGVVQGHLYDASDCVSGCSCGGASAPIRSSSISVAGANVWSLTPNPLSLNVDINGGYSFNAYLGNSGNTFTFDFSNLVASGLVGDATPKVKCDEATPTLLGCDTGYTGAQPCQPIPAKVFDFGFYRKYGGWWQATGASVHANTTIQSKIPASLTLLSDQRLIKTDSYNRDGLISYGTSVNLGTNPNVQSTYTLSNRRFQQTYQGMIYNYAFFDTKFKTNTSTEWTTGNTPPAYADPGGKGYMLVKYAGAGPLSLSGFSVANGQKYVIMVPQDINVTGNITVANGGFLAIMTKGNIHFGSGVSIVHGWYLADGQIVTDSTGVETTDLQLHGEGSFVAWEGFTLNRDRGVLNNKTPSQEFIYRKDMMTNIPSILQFPYKYYAPYTP
ncbi:MAG TPA: hypothetical protein VF837_04820, partial [Patescibacteria group bacterium]